MSALSKDGGLLWTMDADGNTIQEDACIFTGTQADLDRVQQQHQGQGGMDVRIVGWRPGKFSECWMRLTEKPRTERGGTALIHGAARNPVRCRIAQAPNREWRVTPVDAVMVPMWEKVE